jgi:hypothetical protein
VRLLTWGAEQRYAEDALEKLATLCHAGMDREWEFTEWAHGLSGRPMGKAFQAWSAASYVAAYLRFQGDDSMEVLGPGKGKGKVGLADG